MVAPAADFKSLRVNIQAAAPYSKDLFIKQHSGKDHGVPAGRALFIAGIPISIAAEDLVELFSAFGDVQSAAVHPTKTTAIAVFSEQAACSEALAAAANGTVLELTPGEPAGATGLKAWVNAHKARFPGNDELQRQLDAWTEDFEAAEERKRKAAEEAADDGWTVVKRHRGRGKTTDEASGVSVGGVAAAAAEEAGGKVKENLTTNFYRFQQREKRRDELYALREQFEADKQKIAAMKASRRFRPL